MPAKRPSSKPAKTKKTVSRKAAPTKKPAVKAAGKPAAKASAKHGAKPSAKLAKAAPSKPAAKVIAKAPTKPIGKIVTPAPPKAVKPESAKAAKPEAVKKPAAVAAVKPAPVEVKMPVPKPAVPKPIVKSGPKPVVAVGIAEKKRPVAQSVDAEDGDGSEAGANLLAGPRNVTPYQAKRGEQYMNKEQLEHFQHILASWKRDLMEEVDRTVLHMKDEAANFPDPNDRATQESEFSLELRTRDRERKLIRKIEEALARVEDGSYGYCVETGEEIGVKRLEARPVATLCVEAQERRERREKQYGDRDDRYR
ncbi:MAG: RNA polymerase-binding protein DksA [Candidatus Obscuribacterales bacterium]|nr:RNA polymerase-binding protein DksA [Steroidobacteraceae bacterium]